MFERILILGLIAFGHVGAALAEDLPLRDPTQPYREQQPGARGAVRQRTTLSAVLISPLRRVAVIDGKLYHEGELVDGATLTRIESHAVHLRRGSEEKVLRLDDARASTDETQGDSAR